jgi:S1-C subfamily serine protease
MVMGMLTGACRDLSHDASSSGFPTIVGQVNAAFPAVVRIRGRGDLAQGNGSGFFIRGQHGEPLIVTNHHVIWGADSISVDRADGTTDIATLVGADPSTDLAVLAPHSQSVPGMLSFGDDSVLSPGDWLFSLGSPSGLFNATSVGILSARTLVPRATVVAQNLVDHIFAEASLGPGGSGGPLIDLHGHVVGVNVAEVGTSRGFAIAIPSALASKVVSDLARDGRSLHSSAGLDVVNDVESPLSHGLVKVISVLPGDTAESANIRVGDQILSISGSLLHGVGDFRIRIYTAKPGSHLKCDVVRDGKHMTLVLNTRELTSKDTR